MSSEQTVAQQAPEQRTLASPSVLEDLKRLRERSPLTHCITNIVVTGFTANVLLALGASPAMVIAVEESPGFAAVADALLINVGTVTSSDVDSMIGAARSALQSGTPWVLDPVAVGPLHYRTELVGRLLEYQPSVIRGNGSEILALAGVATGGKGADSTAGSAEAVRGAQELASRTGAVVAVSGEVDYVTDGSEVVAVPGGHVLLTKVTGTGCALGAVIAAFLAVSDSPLEGALSASAVFAAAGERAAAQSRGPGGLASALLDNLYLIGQAEQPR
ncbi:MAG: hydroxyethylthiazole kinase [Solirubrobacteraceae bacterium]